MSNYRFRTRPHTHPRLGGEGISAEAIGWLLPDAVVVEIAAEGAAVIVELQLERETHLEALNEIFAALQRLGYSVIGSTVSEWVDAAVETALAGALSLGGSAQAQDQGREDRSGGSGCRRDRRELGRFEAGATGGRLRAGPDTPGLGLDANRGWQNGSGTAGSELSDSETARQRCGDRLVHPLRSRVVLDLWKWPTR